MAEPVTAAELADALRGAISSRAEFIGANGYAKEILDRYDAQQATKAQECTGVAAVWCSRCGDCTCSDREEFASTPNDKCPLHGPRLVEAIRKQLSEESEAATARSEPSKPARDESRDVWIPKYVLEETLRTKEPRTGRILPNSNSEYSRLGFVRYIQCSQFDERNTELSNPALSEVEKAAVNLLRYFGGNEKPLRVNAMVIWNAWDAAGELRDALRKRGAW